MVKDDEIVPTLNRFIQSVGTKAELTTLGYSECITGLANISSVSGTSSSKDVYDRLLTRLLQHGHLRVSSVETLLEALRSSATKETIPLFTRLLFYLVQLALGCGAAGTPLPMPANRGSLSLPKAIDSLPPEILSGAWADLSDEKAPFMRKQGSMRALAALAHAALVSKPDDPMYPAGLLVTLERLLDTIDQLQAGRNSLASVLAATAAAEANPLNKRKNMVVEFKQQMEMQALLRLAFSTARACLSKSGLLQIAPRSFPGITSPDAVCARHSLALAAMAAKEMSGVKFAQYVGPYLQNNVERAKSTGVMFAVGSKAKAGAPPTVQREDTSSYLNLKDSSARIYLARGCAAAIQGGMGDIHNSGSMFWDALVLLACADPSDLVSLDAMRSMFGAPYPRAELLRKKLAPSEIEIQDVGIQGRMLAASWQMVMSMADTPPPAPEDALTPEHPGLASTAVPNESALTSQTSAEQPAAGAGTSLFGRMMSRVLALLQSRSSSLVTAAAKTAAVILESRAWSVSYSGHLVETEGVKKSIRVLQSVLMGVFKSDSLGAVERCAIAEALVWLQLNPPDDPRQSTLPPHVLLKAASQGGLAVQPVVKALFADPWPEGLAYSFLFTLLKRLRCSAGLAGWCCQLAGALAAATPSQLPRDMLAALWAAAPGKDSMRSALELLGSPSPPTTQPLAGTQVEVKLLAAVEEQAYENLRGTAAWWIGEHVNALAGVLAWKPPTKATVALEFLSNAGEGAAQLGVGERLALAAQAHAPLMVMAMTHLQRHMLTGTLEVKVACAQALAKVAVRSPEPYRIQAYATLRAAGGTPAADAACDPLGLAPTILPVLEVLDNMYAGQQVVAQQCGMHGAEAKAWPAPALASLRRRHEWLLAAIAHRVGAVPKDTFFPLGRKSRALLNPDEPPEPELLEADEDEKGLDKAKEAAEQEEQGNGYETDGYYSDQYDDNYDDPDYYPAEGRRDPYNSDPLAKWQPGSNGDYSPLPAVNWKLGESTAYAATPAGDDDDARYGKVQYTFDAANDEEVSVAQGDRVHVLYNMGEWMQVVASSGQQGLVPSSYVQLEGPGNAPSVASQPSLPGQTSFRAESSQYYGQEGGTEQYDEYGDGTYQGYVYDGGAQHEYAMYDAEGENVQGYEQGGGYDDFGAALLAAAEARQAAQARQTERSNQRQAQASLNRAPSASSTISVSSNLQATNSMAPGSLQQSYSIQSSVAGSTVPGTPQAQQQARPAAGMGWGGYGEEQSGYNAGYGQQSTYGETSRVQEQEEAEAETNASPYAPVDAASAAPEKAAWAPGGRGRAMYDFNAEMDEEMSIAVGDEIEVLEVVDDDWLRVFHPSDGRSGLVPSAYLQSN